MATPCTWPSGAPRGEIEGSSRTPAPPFPFSAALQHRGATGQQLAKSGPTELRETGNPRLLTMSKFSITVCTAYTSNYLLGRLCEDVNERYCRRHGYRFVSEVMSPEEMQAAIEPRACFSWYKVVLLNRLIEESTSAEGGEGGAYILWVDADACVVRQERTIESVIALGQGKDLIVGEDLSAACLINAGVLLVRVTPWSQALFRDLWARQSRFRRHRYFEQSELLKQLHFRNEGLEAVIPFHSYRNGPAIKHFPHVTVLLFEELIFIRV